MIQHAILVDPLSGGRFLAGEFARRGIPSVAVLSVPVPAVLAGGFLPENFAAIMYYDGDVGKMCAQLAPYAPACIMTGVETGLALMDQLAAHFSLPGNDPATSALRRDKYMMQEAVGAAGLRAARQLLASDVGSARAWLLAHDSWPVIVKPTNSAGSDNVTLCDDMAQALQAVAGILGSTNLFGLPNANVLVQEYLHGREWVVDTVSCHGRHVVTNVTRYLKLLSADSKVIYRHSQFMSPASEEHAELIAYAVGVIDTLGIQFGSAHIEMIMTASGPILVEVNARMHGGDAVVELKRCNDVTQLDLSVDAYIDQPAFAEKARRDFSYKQHMIAHFLIAKSAGQITSIAAAALLENVPSYVKGYLPAIGNTISKTISLTTAPGYLWLAHADESILWADQQHVIDLEDRELLYSCQS